jgi:hypothetical protein
MVGVTTRRADFLNVFREMALRSGRCPARAETTQAPSQRATLNSRARANARIGNAIRMMCRSPKSRAGCHFAAAIGLRSMLEGFAPEIPDWANDQHTLAGKKLGRGLDHFRREGAKLYRSRPSPTRSLRKPTGCGLSSSGAGELCCREARVIFVCAVSVCC